jgi:hypothetical protein
MQGFAEFKSHILRRDEKGMFGIPFKRLLACGLGGGMITTVSKIPFPSWSVLLGILGFFVLLVLTAPRGGIPRWRHLWYGWQWRLLVAAATSPTSALGKLGRELQLPIGSLDIDGDLLFSSSEENSPRTALTDWVSFTQPDEAEGLVLLDNPGLGKEG